MPLLILKNCFVSPFAITFTTEPVGGRLIDVGNSTFIEPGAYIVCSVLKTTVMSVISYTPKSAGVTDSICILPACKSFLVIM